MYLIYCDESCHLEKDKSDVMVLGAVTCLESHKNEVFNHIRNIKRRNGISTWNELKWTKLSDSKLNAYLDLVEYFFKNEHLQFRAVIATNKSKLDHDTFNNSNYDTWYYKMYYILLNPIIHLDKQYRIFIDIKDTQGGAKVRTLHKVLRNRKSDYLNEVIRDIRLIRSHESEIMQITDILIGAISYFHRGLFLAEGSSNAKNLVVERILSISKIDLNKPTPLNHEKFNIFVWKPNHARRGF